MTNEQAKKFANCLKNNYTIDFNDMADFCDTVIKLLEQQPSEDCASKAEVLSQIKEWRDYEFVRMTNPYHYLEKRIQSIPPVTPTHGTCKDCTHRGAIYADGDCFCDKDGLLRVRGFYCKDFEKRGNEDGWS